MPARLYARFSTDRQSEASITDQWRICEQHAAAKGWEIAARYSDEGISGAALGNRPGVQLLLAELRPGDVLLVCDISRLSRSQDLAPLVRRLLHRGVSVIGVQDGFDAAARTARMQAGLSGIMSEEFRSMVADRTHSALETRAREGRPTGGKAYGDSEIILEIFHRWVAGETLRSIANSLNARGVPSPGASWNRTKRRRDGRWLSSTLHEIISNERYAGRRVWNRSRWERDPDTGVRHRRERPREEWIVRECAPIVDEATWLAAQARLKPRAGPGGGPRYLLSGLLSCGLCGARLIVVGGSQHRYRCGSNHAGGDAACANRHTVPRELAERMLLAPVLEDLLSPDAIRAGVKALREATVPPRRRESEEVVALERLVREGVLSPEVAAPSILEARKRSACAPVPFLAPPSPDAWRQAVEGMREILTGEDVPAAREALRELLGDVVCRPQGEYMVAELTARQVLLATGTGRWVGSGGVLLLYLPVSSRRLPQQ